MKILTKKLVLKNIFKILAFVNTVLLVSVILFLLFEKVNKTEEIVFVDKEKVFENFLMTKESKTLGEKEFSSRKEMLDSLYVKLQKDLPQSEKEVLMKSFIEKREELESFNQNFGFQESDKIWKRLLQYSEEYSQQNGYKLILLSEKGNNVLNGEESLDVTNSFLEFANSRYSGFKK